VAVALTPFSLVPDRLGNVLWQLLNAGVYLGALAWCCCRLLPSTWTRVQRALFFILILPMSAGSLSNGQSNALVMGCILVAVVGVAGKRWNLASISMAVACLFKAYPIAVGLLLAVGYRRHFADRFALALLAGLAAPFVMQKPAYVAAQYQGWLQHLQSDDRQQLPPEETYRDLRLLCRVWLTPLSARAYLVVQLAAAGGIAALCFGARKALGSEERFLALILALGCCWMTVFGPATESCTYLLLAPPLAWALIQAWREPENGMARTVLLACYALFVVHQVALWFPGGKRLGGWGPQPLAALLFCACLVISQSSVVRRQLSCSLLTAHH
jgi:hypothetical protein